jgi:hypothetical protein
MRCAREACGEKRAGAAAATDGSRYLVRMDKDDALRMHDRKPGDRVRITRQNRLTGYLPGDRGQVVVGPEVITASEVRYYLVAIKEVPARSSAVFAEDEIEPDV